MSDWKRILKIFLKENYESLINNNIEWMIMGSMATALQGCNIIPNDMDIIMNNKDGVYYLANLMSKYAIKECDEKAVHFNENWQSTKMTPVLSDAIDPKKDCWTFGRWYINDFKIECANIIPRQDFLKIQQNSKMIFEGKPEAWDYLKFIKFENYNIPVIPLEIQLETNFYRNIKERIEEIINVFKKNGYNHNLLKKSLSTKNMEKFNLWI